MKTWGLDATAPKKLPTSPRDFAQFLEAEKTGSLKRAEGANMQTKPNQFLIKEGAPVGGEAWRGGCVCAPRGHSWRSVSQSGISVIKARGFPAPGSYLCWDYPCREAWTSDSLLQLGVPIFCARWYRSESPK